MLPLGERRCPIEASSVPKRQWDSRPPDLLSAVRGPLLRVAVGRGKQAAADFGEQRLH